MNSHIQLSEALAANRRANLIIGQQAAELKVLQDKITALQNELLWKKNDSI